MSFRDIELKSEYRSLQDNIVTDFYIPILKESTIYKRAVGFFSSSSLVELSAGIFGLIQNGGKMQLVASPKLSADDVEAIEDGIKRRDDIIQEALLRELYDHQGKFEQERLNLLSNLIATGRLELKIAFLEKNNHIGMFHEKLGLMYDSEQNVIAFSGSMNETENAFEINYEAIDIFTSWTSDSARVLSKEAAFNAIWNDYEPSITVLEFPEVNRKIIEKYRTHSIIEPFDSEIVPATPDDLEKKQSHIGPCIPESVEIRAYQQEAIDCWIQNNYRGIFDMATGTGKTYTALAAIARTYDDKARNLAVIIVCPYQHLVEQWKKDIVFFGMKPIVCYSASSQKNWKDRLKTSVTSFNIGVQKHFCVVTTNATFSLEYVQNEMKRLKGNVLLVVDEAHNFGAKKLSNTLLEHYPFRLALSATINRHGDEEGTKILYDYFGKKCIEYTLKEAISNDMLTPYYYYPVVISLNEEELEKYLEITEAIRKNIHEDKNGKLIITEYVKMLLIKRARIVAGAREKIARLKELMQSYVDDNQILVYCGATTMHDVDYEEGKPQIEEAKQIDIVADMLGNDLGMRISKFTSQENSDERERIKRDFAEGKQLQALVAIRCLDEGVNIPSIKTAFILASSTNPKEYVQRRGRVLRKSPGKTYAKIYDFITLPFDVRTIENYDEETINSARSLVKRELIRMSDFAEIAINPFESDMLINNLKYEFDIDLTDITEEDEYV